MCSEKNTPVKVVHGSGYRDNLSGCEPYTQICMAVRRTIPVQYRYFIINSVFFVTGIVQAECYSWNEGEAT